MIQDRSDTARNDSEHVERGRVKALAKLGLAIGIAYSAPVILRLNRVEAHATDSAHCAAQDFKPQHCP